MSDLLEKFIDFNEQHLLIQKDNQVLVAVSGGIDSVVLFHLLMQLKDQLHLRLEIVHVNHGMRGEQSDQDQKFVEDLAKAYHVGIISQKVDVPKFIATRNYSQEQGARILRYRCFEQALKNRDADCLALAHHADDQVETIIDHFLRGSGVRGLAGMAVRRDKFVRPLLFASRKEIETYANSHSLHFVIDATNIKTEYRRNRIRHELMPYLKQHFNSALEPVLLRSAAIMAEIEGYLNHQAQAALEKCLIKIKKQKIILDIDLFLNYFIPIQKYMLFQLADRIQIDRSRLTSQRLDRMLRLIEEGRSGKRQFLNSDWEVLVDRRQLIFQKVRDRANEIEVSINEIVPLWDGDMKLSTRLITMAELPDRFSRDKNVEYIDYDRVEGDLKVRHFENGDRFRPLKFQGEKKLSDYFIDQKISRHERNEIPLLVCDRGIIWIMGHQIDDRFKITSQTKRVLKLQLVKEAVE